LIVDLFAGPGGWSEGLRLLGLKEVGLEMDDAACRTRAAAGHPTIRCDVSGYPTEVFEGAWGIIASPPCTDFSMAGKRAGVKGGTGRLVYEVLRWVGDLRPTWVACEQVPPVLPIWEEFAEVMQGWGYSTWCGVLNAADYGVPQTRKRAILIGSREREVGEPKKMRGKEEWVTMADALGWETGAVVTTRGDRKTSGGNRFSADRPSWCLTEKTRSWVWTTPATTMAGNYDDRTAIKLTVDEAAALQTFPVGYPFTPGSRGGKSKQFEQIGNAVPPLLAANVIAEVLGRESVEWEGWRR